MVLFMFRGNTIARGMHGNFVSITLFVNVCLRYLNIEVLLAWSGKQLN